MGKYASGTGVSEESSRQEIERIIRRYGGDLPSFGWGKDEYTAVIGFRHSGRYIRLDVIFPRPDDKEIALDARSYRRTPAGAKSALNQERRRRWRVLVLRLKAKFEALSEGVPVDEEFMPYILLADGRTVGQVVIPEIEAAYLTGRTPSLMLGMGREGE